MDTARAAAMSDPDLNRHFRRRWESPPPKTKSPLAGDTAQRAEIESTAMQKHLTYASNVFKNFGHAAKNGGGQ